LPEAKFVIAKVLVCGNPEYFIYSIEYLNSFLTEKSPRRYLWLKKVRDLSGFDNLFSFLPINDISKPKSLPLATNPILIFLIKA